MEIILKSRSLLTLLLLLALSLVLLACGAGSSDTPEQQQEAITSVSIPVSGGKVDWSAEDDSGINATLSIANNALDSETSITVKAITASDNAIKFVPGTQLEFGPDGLVFNVPAILVIKYNPANLNGISETTLSIYEYSNGVWNSLSSTVDTNSHTVTTEINGFSWYGLGTEIVAPTTTATPGGGTYTNIQNIVLNCVPDGGAACNKTYYTIDGSDPGTTSTVYSGPITIVSSTTLKFFSIDTLGNQESTQTEEYQISSGYSLGGSVTGLNATLVLQINNGNNYSVSANGPFVFPVSIQDGTNYLVSIAQQPNGQTCDLANEQGAVAGADINNVTVTCINNSLPPPSAPSGVTATSADTQVTLNWQSVDGADRYHIYWNTTGNVSVSDTMISNITDTSYLHSLLSNGTTYYYIITALNENGESVASNQISATPVSPGDAPAWQWTVQPATSGVDQVHDIAIDGAGNVYVAGTTTEAIDGQIAQGNFDIFVSKYNTQGGRQWTVQNGTSAKDYGWGIDVDNNGNTYITGHTYGSLDGNANSGDADIFISKYDTDGMFQWTMQSGTQLEDRGYDVAVDKDGNAYITGLTKGALNGNTGHGSADIFISKYDSNGNHAWTMQRGTGSFDAGYGIAVDDSGSVYVTGYAGKGLDGNNHQGGNDIIIAKFNTNGIHQWTVQSGTSESEFGYGIALDTSNNIFISGVTAGDLGANLYNGGSQDAFVAKYNSNGVHQWTALVGTSGADWGYGASVDSTGNVYATGTTDSSLDGNKNRGQFDIFLTKYDTDGQRLWTLQPGTTAYDQSDRIVVDNSGGIYLAGMTYGGLDGNSNQGNADAFISKYGSSEGGGYYTVGGNASGVIGTFVLQNNNGDDLTINDNGNFVFNTALPDGANYSVTIKSQPQGGLCFVSGGHEGDGSGQISGANVTNIVIECVGV